MHGEYKTPGGKLVVVDFAVQDNQLRDVRVSGDFFLYPEDALSDITAALEGAPADLTEEQIATRIEGAIPPGTEWLGTSPAALAIAVRRALASTPESELIG
ncbi:MAG TPA: biotin--protein ligase [Thermomicrobiales bacterium]